MPPWPRASSLLPASPARRSPKARPPPDRNGRHRRHLLPNRRTNREQYIRPGREARARRGRDRGRLQRLRRQRQRDLERLLRIRAVAIGRSVLAYSGTGLYEGKPKVQGLRVIATLYPETQLVTRKDAGIRSIIDLRGKQVSIDEPASGTIVDARLVLAAFGLTEKDFRPEYLKPGPAADRLRDGALDAAFVVGG